MADDDKKAKKDKKPEEERSYTGTKDPADPRFAEWIAKQWRRGETLQKIDVIQYHARGANKGYGNILDSEVFTAGHDVNLEEAVDLSNRLIGSAQLDCDRIIKKEMTYYARAFDRGRNPTSDPVDTFPLLLRPKTIYLDGRPGDDEDATPQSVALDYLREGTRAYQFDRTREDSNIGDLITMFITERREQRQWEIEQQGIIRTILRDYVEAIRDRERARSEELDRLPQRELLKIKAEIFRDGWRSGRNLLTGAIGAMMGDREKKDPDKPKESNGIVVTRMTQERMLIDNFFQDCKNAGVDVALFGEWKKGEDGHLELVKKGVFEPDQFLTLAKVLTGHLAADALDDLMPDSGKPLAITMDQLKRAEAIEGMTEGIASSMILLLKARQEKRERAETPPAAQTTATTAPVPTPPTPDQGVEDV